MLGPAEGEGQLLALGGVGAASCSELPATGPECGENRAATWSELASADRPLLLDLVTPERFGGTAVLLGVDGRSGWLLQPGPDGQPSFSEIDLAELGSYWTGGYRFLWQPPEGYSRPLSPGNNSPVVARIAQLFAELDQQDQPLAGQRFNSALEQRVKLFQQNSGLEADGVVGVQTLLRLNERVGVDVRASDLRRQLAGTP